MTLLQLREHPALHYVIMYANMPVNDRDLNILREHTSGWEMSPGLQI